MIGEKQKTNEEGFVNVSTKVPLNVSNLLNILARMRGMEVYEILQLLVTGFISYAKAEQSVPEEFRRLYESLKFEAAWNNAYNFASLSAQNDIAQLVMVLQQPGHRGFGLAMINKPFMSEATMTRSVPDILDRVLQLALGENDYRRMQHMNKELECPSSIDSIRAMLDAQELMNIAESDREELPGYGDRHEYGRVIEYGKRTRQVKHRTPDSLAESGQQRIKFSFEDREQSDNEAGAPPKEGFNGWEPFGVEP